MSDTTTVGPWTALVVRYPVGNSDIEEETRLSVEAGYETQRVLIYNETRHETEEKAKAVVENAIRNLKALKPKANWRGWVVYDIL